MAENNKMEKQIAEKASSLIASFTFKYHSLVIREIQKKKLNLGVQDEYIYSIIFKTNSALDSLNLLFCNFSNKNHFQPSIFIILRSILNDIILTEFINNQGRTEGGRIELIKRVKFDHVDRFIRNIDGIFRITNRLTDEEVAKKVKKIKEEFPDYFDGNGDPKVKKLNASPESMVKIIFSQSKKETDLRFLRKAMHFYDIYSKYEHFGHLSSYLIHRPYIEKEIEYSFEDATNTVNMIMSAMVNYTRNWEEFGDDVRKPLEETQQKYQELIRSTRR